MKARKKSMETENKPKRNPRCPICKKTLVKGTRKKMVCSCGYYEYPCYDHTRPKQSERKRMKKMLNRQQNAYDKLRREYEKEQEIIKNLLAIVT